MGAVEKGAHRKRVKRNIQNAAIMAIGVAGVIAIAAIAPNAARLLETTGLNARWRYQASRALSRLKQKGKIEFVEENGTRSVRLTEKGERAFLLEKQRLSLAKKTRKWDRRYRLVAFDVPEKRKQAREYLRFEMHEVGFLRIQDSVWVYPYECEEFIELLKTDLHIGKNVLYAVVEEIGNDKWIRAHFGLPAA